MRVKIIIRVIYILCFSMLISCSSLDTEHAQSLLEYRKLESMRIQAGNFESMPLIEVLRIAEAEFRSYDPCWNIRLYDGDEGIFFLSPESATRRTVNLVLAKSVPAEFFLDTIAFQSRTKYMIKDECTIIFFNPGVPGFPD